jgi:nitrilase
VTIAAAIQMASGPTVHANLIEAERHIAAAAKVGAKLVVLPENFALMGMHDRDGLAAREHEGSGSLQDFLAGQAARHGVWLVGGTIPMHGDDPERGRAACLVFDPSGRRAARYDKIHLFDVNVDDERGCYQESSTIEPGREVVVVETGLGMLGLAICYDLRFPELFRALLDRGAQLIALPAAFTAVTGRAHWEVLVRARAVENLCYIVAAAQGGYHANGRETYGHSMVVDPWGVVLDRLPRGSGTVLGNIDLPRQLGTRTRFPCLEHRRLRFAEP